MASPDQAPSPAKDPAAFRTIREVSELLGVPQHVLRFWETRFPELKPLQRGGNRRYYRPADVAFATALHKLLHQDGFTVKGVRKLITDHGAANLVTIANGEAPAPRGRRVDAPPPATVIAAQTVVPPGDESGPAPQAQTDAQPPAPIAEAPAMLAQLRALRDTLASALAA